MAATEVVFFAEDDVSCPMLLWLKELSREVRTKVVDRVRRLEEHGHELRRPLADYLRDGVYELRVKCRNVQYRILYFFREQRAVLSHGIRKKGERVPDNEIDRAADRKRRFEIDPSAHTYIF